MRLGGGDAANIHRLAGQIATLAEVRQNREMLAEIAEAVGGADRLVVLGFGFDPANVELLFPAPLDRTPRCW